MKMKVKIVFFAFLLFSTLFEFSSGAAIDVVDLDDVDNTMPKQVDMKLAEFWVAGV